MLALTVSPVRAADEELPWDLDALASPPRVYEAPGFAAEGVRGLFFEALPWKGKPTRVFAWYGAPGNVPAGGKVPAMVLVHGGGGTAFDAWVRQWTRRGYAALAIDVEGTVPRGEFPNRPRGEWSGPARSGGFADLHLPEPDQWFYHAVADVVLAHSLLRSLPEVDPDRVGLTGISWGGVLTCVAAGVDHRFKLAVPVYGCGFLADAPVFQAAWAARGPGSAGKWMRLWDPSRYLPSVRAPMLWVNGANDLHFPLDIHRRSWNLVQPPGRLCIRVGMKHGHAHGWEPAEIYAFADSILREGEAPAKVRAWGCADGRCRVEFDSARPPRKAELVYSEDVTDWVRCRWLTREATIDAAGTAAEAALPEGCAAWFFNLVDARGLLTSSPVELGPGVATTRAASATASTEPEPRPGFPPFTWDRVPLAAHLGKPSGDFTDEEARFLARFPLVTIEKTQGLRTSIRGERAMHEAARRIKRFNPDAKVLFYWNAFLAYPMYDAHAVFVQHPEWALTDRAGEPVLIRGRVPAYDLSRPDLRNWWTGVAAGAVTDGTFDGVFADAIPKVGMAAERNRQAWGDAKSEAVESGLRRMLARTRQQMGPRGLLIYNGLRGAMDQWPDGGARYLRFTDGAMVEHFAAYSGRDANGRVRPEWLAADLELIRKAGEANKIVVVKAWPNFAGLPADAGPEAKARAARETITFPLAAFLAAAERHAYFSYGWGYTDTDGTLAWYPEYDRKLGPPKGPASRDGWIYHREFEHASIRVDISKEEAVIDWR